jgi:hypothetical protein
MSESATVQRSMQKQPSRAETVLENGLSDAAEGIADLIALARAVDPAADEFGHARSRAYSDAVALLKASARVGHTIAQLRGSKFEHNINVRRENVSPNASAIRTGRKRTTAPFCGSARRRCSIGRIKKPTGWKSQTMSSQKRRRHGLPVTRTTRSRMRVPPPRFPKVRMGTLSLLLRKSRGSEARRWKPSRIRCRYSPVCGTSRCGDSAAVSPAIETGCATVDSQRPRRSVGTLSAR